jgi:hypothetical protein
MQGRVSFAYALLWSALRILPAKVPGITRVQESIECITDWAVDVLAN